jgi:hypothetical protein
MMAKRSIKSEASHPVGVGGFVLRSSFCFASGKALLCYRDASSDLH